MDNLQFCDRLHWYVNKQLDNLFPSFDGESLVDRAAVEAAVDLTCFTVSKIKVYSGARFDYQNSTHYATFLYWLSRTLWARGQGNDQATRVFLLNKAVNGIDLFYEIEMPKVFLLTHSTGMVFAKATYGSHFQMHQNCTVGRNQDDRPVIEPGVVLYPNSAIIGQCHVRENTVLTPGVKLVNRDTPGNCYVFAGEGGEPTFKPIKEYFIHRYLHP
ncbi:LbetaH domain-containing protein [Pandoraea norimbergensis]|uniref:Serine acetyltransferase n=1 Tax=Pandoraea norimbergensis TaxID=93219 RepID=A0ABM5WGW1_9BURK|nr:hypothetical protein [Pandoraea norimbergensis]